MKSVAIVGAGPSGLVAAKTLLHSYPGKFDVTILEKSNRIGGMWAVQRGEIGGTVSPDMATNLSRFTVAFSDLAWESVNLGHESSAHQPERSDNSRVPMFPKAWQVGRYLQAYARKFIPEEVIHLESMVTSAKRVQHGNRTKWKVEWTAPLTSQPPSVLSNGSVDGTVKQQPEYKLFQDFFDYLIVASGFFSSPRPPDIGTSTQPVGVSSFQGQQVHSSRFRALSDLVPSDHEGGGNIVIIGGGMSGAEAAATAAFQISNTKYSPTATRDLTKLKVYHVCSRPFYNFPRYLPREPRTQDKSNYQPAPSFVPLDLCLYDLSRRPEGPILPMNGLVSADKASKSHMFMRSMIGGDQSDLGAEALVHSDGETRRPAYVAISDNYDSFVRSGDVVPVRGRVVQLYGRTDSKASTTEGLVRVRDRRLDPEPGQDVDDAVIENVVCVIHATGFTPHSGIKWMAEDVLDTIKCESRCHRLPLLLHHHSVRHDKIPELAFVGFYEGPYWGVMEMQSRMIATKWAAAEDSVGASTEISEEWLEAAMRHLRDLREAMMQSRNDVPQFWMGDYMGLMEGLARDLGIARKDLFPESRSGPALAARYPTPADNQPEAERTLESLRKTLDASGQAGKFVAAAAFRAMQGRWILQRRVTSRLPGFPSGEFEGIADFHPRESTDAHYDAEYLYIEDGTLNMDNGITLRANKRYVYRYCEAVDQISVWFAKEDGKTVDYLFYEMAFQMPKPDDVARGWVAKGFHYCSPDDYDALCEFKFRGAALDSLGITYLVKGPRKDYTSETWYGR